MTLPADDAERSQEYQRDLPAGPQAAGEARRGVAAVLTSWRLPELIDSCQLVVSELVTNALRHGLPPVGLMLRRRTGAVRLDVSDASPEDPASQAPASRVDPDSEGGRGLELVRAVTDEHGVEQIPDDGKRVFAAWHLDDPPDQGS